jgi:hypothetical protein
MKRRISLFMIFGVLVSLAFIPYTANAESLCCIDVCMWYSGGCFVTVIQYSWGFWDIGWEMFINCWFPSSYGYWSGWGEWGGVCQGITFPL